MKRCSNLRFLCRLFFLAPLLLTAPAGAAHLVGVARIDITPDYPVRLSGYGNRTTESEGIEQRIWAKALAIGSDEDGPAVLLTVDNCGVSGEVRAGVLERLNAGSRVADARFTIASSHTHSAPMIRNVLPNLFSADIPPDEQKQIDRYTGELTDALEAVALKALANRRPANLAWGIGSASFGSNRRYKDGTGPVDHDLPVLRVTGPDGELRAILTSYACHCTAISGKFNRICGDWAGYAQQYLEEQHPGLITMVAIVCAGDQNPARRFGLEFAQEHGREIALQVDAVLKRDRMKNLDAALECRKAELKLPFDKLPTREEWAGLAQSKRHQIAYHASRHLARLDRGETLPTDLDYSVQTWCFGDQLAMVFLAGEVVVDYSLRLKRDYDRDRIWVNAYSNDVPCYIPSERVLREGGYEGASAMVYYDRPTRFAPGVETRIFDALDDVIPRSFKRVKKALK